MAWCLCKGKNFEEDYSEMHGPLQQQKRTKAYLNSELEQYIILACF